MLKCWSSFFRCGENSRRAIASCSGWGLILWLLQAPLLSADENQIDYDRDIRPILSEKCFTCHGPDAAERQGGFRLDQPESAQSEADSGSIPIVPGHPERSELIARIQSEDESLRMPPEEMGKPLSASEIELLNKWIQSGAQYRQLWSFVPPVAPALPPVKDSSWVRNGVDAFVLQRLEAEGRRPSPEADRETLIRRVTLDLTGLPPLPEEIDAFLADQSPDAYERLVDRLLDSPRYGERMALDWLDAARYADTHGYHIDSGRDMTVWRKWVIDSFNRNLPFDQFTIEQLAGDLLPDATLEQQIASGFNRNHMINFEGGAIPEEYHAAYIVDRVNTTSTVWLGLTVACAQCHDHKYDPISQRDYFQLYAFFHNVPERGLDGSRGNAEPKIALPTPEQVERREELDREIKRRDEELAGLDEGSPERAELESSLQELRKQLESLDKEIPTTMVMREMEKPRETFILLRGEYDKPGDKVEANVPESLPPLLEGVSPDRLALARWLVSPEQPLTARVTVNRYWQLLFGTGLVKTSEDFGSQGERPSHPELLDWLASEFRQPSRGDLPGHEGSDVDEDQSRGQTYGDGDARAWDVKQLMRMLVTSSTYRQASHVTEEMVGSDPENRLLGRGSRFRLPAELIRDLALSVSGLLDSRIGGQSVSPYQPEGLWDELASRADGRNWTAQTYEQSHGVDLYRRSMYTFWKRTSPPPSFATFDAPDRETCVVRRARTNTPLQALVLMNDPTYVEASRKLAERIAVEGGETTAERLEFAFRSVTGRRPLPHEVKVLRELLEHQSLVFAEDPEAADALLSVGEAARRTDCDVAELAAWTVVASALLNLDETITRG